MSFLAKIFKRKATTQDEGWRLGGLEDFMTLIRVYYQAVLAGNLGISNLAALPDLRVFKQTLHVPTANNKLGLAEKNRCKKMLMEIYDMPEYFFKEIDQSVKRNCKNINQMQGFLFNFQGFTQELMMLAGNMMKWKVRVPGFMRKALYTMTQKTVRDILEKDDWKDPSAYKAALTVRRYQHTLGYSQQWVTDYVFHLLVLVKKEKKPKDVEEK